MVVAAGIGHSQDALVAITEDNRTLIPRDTKRFWSAAQIVMAAPPPTATFFSACSSLTRTLAELPSGENTGFDHTRLLASAGAHDETLIERGHRPHVEADPYDVGDLRAVGRDGDALTGASGEDLSFAQHQRKPRHRRRRGWHASTCDVATMTAMTAERRAGWRYERIDGGGPAPRRHRHASVPPWRIPPLPWLRAAESPAGSS